MKLYYIYMVVESAWLFGDVCSDDVLTLINSSSNIFGVSCGSFVCSRVFGRLSRWYEIVVFCTSVAGTCIVVSCCSSEMGFPLHVYCVTCTFSIGSSIC